ncbi:unnamed protein product [Caenorhabditis auriculariae]|uniref:Uncharacterized protein n=1 Tax=Caenorhabditis auriculariae TaxID=2777116 RepID=A0A8S1HQ94_9PELO|nr:unnamed protein product [Caenorhabditis auriculariae]
MIKAYRLFCNNRIPEAEEICSQLLRQNPLDQAAWALKLSCLTETTFVDELENEDVGIAETFLEQNVIAPNARPGTSFQRPMTSSKGVNPILRPTTTAGRPLSGVVRPQTSFKSGSMDQAVRTARTAKTGRAVSSSSARNVRLGTASMASGFDGQFVNLARLNIDKYAADPQVNRQLFEYVFYHENDIKVAHQIAGTATKAANFKDWYWKNQLSKCYLRLGMLADAEKQLLSSLNHHKLVESYAFLAKIYNRMDQPMAALKIYNEGVSYFEHDVTLLTGMARTRELLGEYELSVGIYKRVLNVQANNIEAIACVATTYFYDNKPEVALRYYRRILQMGAASSELFMNIGLCCLACQQFDFALSSVTRAQATMTDDVAADVWYNTGDVMLGIGDTKFAARCFRMALAANADYGEAMVNLGILKHREGKIGEARSLYQAAVAKAPHLFEAHFNLALISYKVATKSAVSWWKRHWKSFRDMRNAYGCSKPCESSTRVCELVTREYHTSVTSIYKWLHVRCPHFDLAAYPKDEFRCKLQFTSTAANASIMALVPHLVAPKDHFMGNAEWQLELHRAFVQWIVIDGDSFEQALFEFKLKRKMVNIVEVSMICMFLVNSLAIYNHFPIFRLVPSSKEPNARIELAIQTTILMVTEMSSPKSRQGSSIAQQELSFLILTILTSFLCQLLPFFAYHFRCCPIEAHPNASDVPSPHDRLSLDSERVRYSAALDSARIDSMKSPRSTAFDSCIAELKFTLANFNEHLNSKANSKWRKKLWRKSYKRAESIAFFVLQTFNVVLFFTSMNK